MLAALCIASPHSAATVQEASLAELAVDIAYDKCPKLHDDEIKLDGPEIKALGFVGAPETRQHPRVGAMQILSLKRGDGEIVIGAATETAFCQVMVLGPQRETAHAALRANLGRLGIDFSPDPASSSANEYSTVEGLSARPEEGVTVGVQFINASGPRGQMAAFQVFITDQ
ncbi:hypothetical protein ATE72_17835 [Sphingopyxis sp. HXXIV]|nr:hypothetical protein ATE72_17835 [Sphingopyxis sp. HXXIV]